MYVCMTINNGLLGYFRIWVGIGGFLSCWVLRFGSPVLDYKWVGGWGEDLPVMN